MHKAYDKEIREALATKDTRFFNELEASKVFLCRGNDGLTLPSSIKTLSALSAGKITPLFKALRPFT